MVKSYDKSIPSCDGIHTLAGRIFEPEGEVKGIFHIVHGMVEHKERHFELLETLAAQGWICLAFDNLGHGASVNDPSEHGYIARRNGWRLLCDDVNAFASEMKRSFGDGLPYVLAGHSMGSFIARLTASLYPDVCDGLIAIGTGYRNPAAPEGLLILDVISRAKGDRYISDFAEKVSIGSYNDRFLEENDRLSWINTLAGERELYRADPLCSFRFTVSAMHDLVKLNIECNSKRCFAGTKKELPIILLSGADDPVGDYGIGIWQVYKGYRRSGHDNVGMKLYKGCRHEIMHDVCKDEFTADVIRFLGAFRAAD